MPSKRSNQDGGPTMAYMGSGFAPVSQRLAASPMPFQKHEMTGTVDAAGRSVARPVNQLGYQNWLNKTRLGPDGQRVVGMRSPGDYSMGKPGLGGALGGNTVAASSFSWEGGLGGRKHIQGVPYQAGGAPALQQPGAPAMQQPGAPAMQQPGPYGLGNATRTPSGGMSWGGFAEGGEVEGPGGPKDDMVPAMLSDGEFIMPAEAVQFHGTDKLQKMIAKAREESSKAMMRPDDAPLRMAAGGVVQFKNPFADDPMAVALRDQQARDAAFAQSGIRDLGQGMRVLNNRYGTGYARVPGPMESKDAPGIFSNEGIQSTVRPGQLVPVPDVVPAGHPAAGPGKWDDPAARRREIAAVSEGMEAGAAGRRFDDLANRASFFQSQPKGRSTITVPFQGELQTPQQRNASLERMRASDPMRPQPPPAPSEQLMPRPEGVSRTDWRRFQRSPAGMMQSAETQERRRQETARQQAAGNWQRVMTPDGQPTNYLSNGHGNLIAADTGAALDPARLIQEMQNPQHPLGTRELFRREFERITGMSIGLPKTKADAPLDTVSTTTIDPANPLNTIRITSRMPAGQAAAVPTTSVNAAGRPKQPSKFLPAAVGK